MLSLRFHCCARPVSTFCPRNGQRSPYQWKWAYFFAANDLLRNDLPSLVNINHELVWNISSAFDWSQTFIINHWPRCQIPGCCNVPNRPSCTSLRQRRSSGGLSDGAMYMHDNRVARIAQWLERRTRTVIERSRVQIPTGRAEELSSPGSTFCADSYFSVCSTPCYRSST